MGTNFVLEPQLTGDVSRRRAAVPYWPADDASVVDAFPVCSCQCAAARDARHRPHRDLQQLAVRRPGGRQCLHLRFCAASAQHDLVRCAADAPSRSFVSPLRLTEPASATRGSPRNAPRRRQASPSAAWPTTFSTRSGTTRRSRPTPPKPSRTRSASLSSRSCAALTRPSVRRGGGRARATPRVGTAHALESLLVRGGAPVWPTTRSDRGVGHAADLASPAQGLAIDSDQR